MFDPTLATKAQENYCNLVGCPCLAPHGGRCYGCGRNIYREVIWPDGHTSGIPVECAGGTVITGCPHCSRTFLD